jgi:hypothetical protein
MNKKEENMPYWWPNLVAIWLQQSNLFTIVQWQSDFMDAHRMKIEF